MRRSTRGESRSHESGDLGVSMDARRNPRPQGQSIGSSPRPNHWGCSARRVGPVNSGALHGVRARPECDSLSDSRSTEGVKTPACGCGDVLVVRVRRSSRLQVARSASLRPASTGGGRGRIARSRPVGVTPGSRSRSQSGQAHTYGPHLGPRVQPSQQSHDPRILSFAGRGDKGPSDSGERPWPREA